MRVNLVYQVLTVLGFLTACLCFFLFIGQEKWMLVGWGSLGVSGLALLPALSRRRIELTDPLNFVLLAVLIGTFLTSVMIAFGDSARRDFIMAWWGIEDYARGASFMALSLFVISIGYICCNFSLNINPQKIPGSRLTPGGIQIGIFLCVIISVFSVYSYVESIGGIRLSDISRKRSLLMYVEGERIHASTGYNKVFSQIAFFMTLIILSYYYSIRVKFTNTIKIQIAILIMFAVFVPFISSRRGEVLAVVFALTFIYASYRRLSTRDVMIMMTVLMLAFSAMTALRMQAHRGQNANLSNPLISLAESGNGLSVAATSAVLLAVPERMPFQYGATLTTWMTAPIPRSVWPGKPEISLGKRIREEIYDFRVYRTGRPISFMAEGFVNFGWIGFFAFSFVFGFALRFVANTFTPILHSGPLVPPLYFIMATNLAGMGNANLSQGIVRTLSDLLALAIAFALMHFVMKRARRPFRHEFAFDGAPK